jgi:NitT/TauT family transport system substrate-binding protein
MDRWKAGMPSFAAPAAAAIVMLASGCTSTVSTAALASLKETTVTVAALPSDDLAGLYIAKDDGYFTAQGLNVKIIKISSSAAVITQQMLGQIDIGAGSYVPYILAQATGARFRILAEASSLRPDTRVLIIPSGSSITSVTQLVGKKIGVNGTNSIGTLLISMLLKESGVPPSKVDFVTDPGGFPAMPQDLQRGEWSAAFLAEPYVTLAEEQYGEEMLADLDQGATMSFPIDGYVTTQAWLTKNPGLAAAFDRAIQQGQQEADSDPGAAQQAMNESDGLSSVVTAPMALPEYPTGPVDAIAIAREVAAMIELGMFDKDYGADVQPQSLVASMLTQVR